MNWKVGAWLIVSALCFYMFMAGLFGLGMSTPHPDQPPGTWGLLVSGKELFLPLAVIGVFSIIMAIAYWKR